jgi:hypothetical protein
MVAAYRTRDGGELFVVETRRLEAAPGWRYSHGGRRGRGACVMHGGDNPAAMEADFETGWITCFTRGCKGRIAEHPGTRVGVANRHRPQAVPVLPPTRPTVLGGPRLPSPDPRARQGLRTALAAAQARLPGSPGERYLGERGFPLAVARAHGLGWGADGAMAGRVVVPLTGPDGVPTSATGRAVDPGRAPKYRTLPSAAYPRGWFNGAAVALARARGWPLYLCEGPFDALALLAGGVPTATAVLGVTGVRTDWLVGLARLVVCFDADAAGQGARAELAFAATAAGVAVELLPPAALAGCKDLGEYWGRHGALPGALPAHWDAALPSDPAVAALVAHLGALADDELDAYRAELEAAPPDDPAAPTEWAALRRVELRRGPRP